MAKVRELMSSSPHTIGVDQPIAEAAERMRTTHIRHLPVLDGSQVVGMLSDRDVGLVEALERRRPRGRDATRVGDVMSPEPYVVDVDVELADVVSAMAQRKLGSAIVTERGKVAGIVTTIDALHLLLRHLAIEDLRGS